MTIIHANIFNPSIRSFFKIPANTKAECQIIDCSNHEQCELYSMGQCACKSFSKSYCFYGRKQIEIGFSKKARRFRSWISEKEEKYKGINFLESPPMKLARVGDYIYLPYSYMDMYKNDLFEKGDFVHNNNFNIDCIHKLCMFRPQAIFGGEIKSYQESIIPLFITHLNEKMPKLYNELCKIYPKAKEILKSKTNVGRKAVLSTIKPNVGVLRGIHNDDWIWDGEYLTMTNKQAGFALVKHSEVRIKPIEGEVVKICDENQVDENTVFID